MCLHDGEQDAYRPEYGELHTLEELSIDNSKKGHRRYVCHSQVRAVDFDAFSERFCRDANITKKRSCDALVIDRTPQLLVEFKNRAVVLKRGPIGDMRIRIPIEGELIEKLYDSAIVLDKAGIHPLLRDRDAITAIIVVSDEQNPRLADLLNASVYGRIFAGGDPMQDALMTAAMNVSVPETAAGESSRRTVENDGMGAYTQTGADSDSEMNMNGVTNAESNAGVITDANTEMNIDTSKIDDAEMDSDMNAEAAADSVVTHDDGIKNGKKTDGEADNPEMDDMETLPVNGFSPKRFKRLEDYLYRNVYFLTGSQFDELIARGSI